MMKSLASLILLVTLTTMSGIRFAQGRGIIDRIAREQGCGRNNGGVTAPSKTNEWKR
jgi:hypothetical protein